ncbi:winged helix-turn-helix domain-containing protein [Luteibaculum oceani]|uniref:Transcriptional regulator n=1 Tax=Luteibaculum oceani TaxID=1294296 RepID=A0A5C6UXZ7_9FLAO|nr:transcriptional regulator [Luteibaculum oceani]TXC76926.1 transcriptional regulator [Luteibaculum oceani]
MAAFKKLDPLLHNQLRLAIISLLMGVEQADFNFLLEKTKATKGNLSVQLSKLKEKGYIEVEKTFKNNYPHTTCKITKTGIDNFEKYVAALNDYLRVGG